MIQVKRAAYHIGEEGTPMTREDLEQKVRGLCSSDDSDSKCVINCE